MICTGTMAAIPTGLKYKNIRKHVPESYWRSYRKASGYLKRNQFYSARKIYSDMIRQNRHFHLYWGYAYAERQIGNLNSARALYYKAFERNDTTYSFLQDYADFLDAIETEWVVVERLAKSLYAVRPDETTLLFVMDKIRDGVDEEDASRFFREMRKLYPDKTNLIVFQAILSSKMGNSAGAVNLSRSAVDNTVSPFQLKMLERIFANNGYFLEAAQVCEKLNRVAKESAYTYDAWAHLEFKQGHYENAAIQYTKSINRKYRVSTLITLEQIYHFYLHDPAQARYYSNAAIRLDESVVDAYFILAEINRKAGKFEKAVEYSAKQLALLPDHPYPLYYHSKLLFEMKQYQDAIPFLERAVSISPDVHRYRLLLAKCYAGAGLVEQAEQIYQNFINEPLKDLWTEEELLRDEPPEPK
jgi:tetratricopeptide (TPR) repeat protein